MENIQPATLEEALRLLAAADSTLKHQSYKLEQQNSKLALQNSKLEHQSSKLEQQKLEIENQKNQIRDLQEKLALQLAYRFCSHTEKYFADQPSLFNEGEISPVPDEDTAPVHDEAIFKEEIVRAYKRNKKGRKPLAEELPRKTVIIDIPETEKQCACGHKLVKVGEDVSERLQYIPSQIYVLRTVRPKYACRNCEGSGDEDKPVFRQADAPHTIVPKSIAGANLLAAVFTNKYELHLPYYRQEKAFEHRMIGISRQDMSSWQETVYKASLPLEKLLMAHIKSGNVLHMDETTVLK